MTKLFEFNSADRCCLCGSDDELTGEHKVKASTLRSVFSGGPLMIGSFAPGTRPRLAQSPKSQAFHFSARVCALCNSTRSQPADVEFALFDETARQRMAEGLDPDALFDEPQYAEEGERYLNVFRYLAKILACQIAEVDGPRILALTQFAIGMTRINPVRLEMGDDPRYQFWLQGSGDPEFAHHGGLSCEISRSTGMVTSLGSSLTHGPLRYNFSIGFGWDVGHALSILHPVFHERCAAAAREALASESRDDGDMEARSD